MKMIKTLATKMVATFSLVALLAAPTTAQALDAADMAFAFGGKGQAAQMTQPKMIASARGMTQTEMQETEGAFWPWVIRAGVSGVITGAGAGSVSWSNGNSGWTVVKHTAIGFATGATGGVASRWLSRRGW